MKVFLSVLTIISLSQMAMASSHDNNVVLCKSLEQAAIEKSRISLISNDSEQNSVDANSVIENIKSVFHDFECAEVLATEGEAVEKRTNECAGTQDRIETSMDKMSQAKADGDYKVRDQHSAALTQLFEFRDQCWADGFKTTF